MLVTTWKCYEWLTTRCLWESAYWLGGGWIIITYLKLSFYLTLSIKLILDVSCKLSLWILIVYSLSIPWRLILAFWRSLLCSLAHAQKILESKWINMCFEDSALSMLSRYSLHVVSTSSMAGEVCLPGMLSAIPCTVLCSCHHCRGTLPFSRHPLSALLHLPVELHTVVTGMPDFMPLNIYLVILKCTWGW